MIAEATIEIDWLRWGLGLGINIRGRWAFMDIGPIHVELWC